MWRKPEPKAQAKILKKALEDLGFPVKLAQAQELVALQLGCPNWHGLLQAMANEVAAKAAAEAAVKQAAEEAERITDNTAINGWSVGDVRSVAPYLTVEEAYEVLENAVHRMDANIGLNWTVFETHAGMTFEPRVLTGTFHPAGGATPVVATCKLNYDCKVMAEVKGKVLLVGNGTFEVSGLDGDLEVESGHLADFDSVTINGIVDELEEAGTLPPIERY